MAVLHQLSVAVHAKPAYGAGGMTSSSQLSCEAVLERIAEQTACAFVDDAVALHLEHCGSCSDVVSEHLHAFYADTPTGSSLQGLPPGANVGRYTVVRMLGAGGMGAVYLAEDRRLGRQVALKVLHGTQSDAQHAQLFREAQVLAKFSHPNSCLFTMQIRSVNCRSLRWSMLKVRLFVHGCARTRGVWATFFGCLNKRVVVSLRLIVPV